MSVHDSLFIGLLELFISMCGVRGRTWRFMFGMTVITETRFSCLVSCISYVENAR